MVSRDQQGSVLADLEDPESATVVCNCKSLPPWHDLQSCETKRSCTLVARLSLVGQRRVDALRNVDILGLPPVTEMAPDVDAEVSAARGKTLRGLVD